MLKKLFFFYVLFGCLSIYSQQTESSYDEMLKTHYKNTVETISPAELTAMMKQKSKYVILDTRGEREYEVSKIKGAVRVGFLGFNYTKNEDLIKDKIVIVYCTIGARSESVGEKILAKNPDQIVYNLYGGIIYWKNNDYPVYDNKNQLTEDLHVYSKSWGQWLKNGNPVY